MELKDVLGLLHPAIAITVVYPLIGIVLNRALQTRQRRLQTQAGEKSKVPASAGTEHVQLGRWLSGSVVGIALLGLGFPIFSKMSANQVWMKEPMRASFVVVIFLATIASLGILYNAKPKLWRAVFATLTSMGLILLGCQPEIFRRTNEWYASHYYFGVAAALLMIISLTTVQEIYQDRKHRWRTAHIILNSLAMLLFIGQGLTGARDLLEIPLSWQEPYIYKCDFAKKVCP
jgi:hypothetical protein